MKLLKNTEIRAVSRQAAGKAIRDANGNAACDATGMAVLNVLVTLICCCVFLVGYSVPVSALTQDELQNIPTSKISNLYVSEANYRIERKGKTVGNHSVKIWPASSNSGEDFSVSVESNIRITVLKVPVFKLKFKSTEQWKDGVLQSISATTQQNDENTIVSATKNETGSGYTLKNNGELRQVTTSVFTSNHWHAGVIGSEQIFNTLTGNLNKVEIASLGVETLDLPGGPKQATRFRYSGELQLDTWYGEDGRWLQLAFEGSDGSEIKYIYEGP